MSIPKLLISLVIRKHVLEGRTMRVPTPYNQNPMPHHFPSGQAENYTKSV